MQGRINTNYGRAEFVRRNIMKKAVDGERGEIAAYQWLGRNVHAVVPVP